jgi:hypothetical protein
VLIFLKINFCSIKSSFEKNKITRSDNMSVSSRGIQADFTKKKSKELQLNREDIVFNKADLLFLDRAIASKSSSDIGRIFHSAKLSNKILDYLASILKSYSDQDQLKYFNLPAFSTWAAENPDDPVFDQYGGFQDTLTSPVVIEDNSGNKVAYVLPKNEEIRKEYAAMIKGLLKNASDFIYNESNELHQWLRDYIGEARLKKTIEVFGLPQLQTQLDVGMQLCLATGFNEILSAPILKNNTQAFDFALLSSGIIQREASVKNEKIRELESMRELIKKQEAIFESLSSQNYPYTKKIDALRLQRMKTKRQLEEDIDYLSRTSRVLIEIKACEDARNKMALDETAVCQMLVRLVDEKCKEVYDAFVKNMPVNHLDIKDVSTLVKALNSINDEVSHQSKHEGLRLAGAGIYKEGCHLAYEILKKSQSEERSSEVGVLSATLIRSANVIQNPDKDRFEIKELDRDSRMVSGKSSAWRKFCGALSFFIGVVLLVTGFALAVPTFGVSAAIGFGIAGALCAGGGVGLFAHSRQKGLAKEISKLKNAADETEDKYARISINGSGHR